MPKKCGHGDCTKQPSYGKIGGKAELCAEHAENGMVNVVKKRCDHSGCTKGPSYGKVGGKAELCIAHAENGMVNVVNKRCGHSGCTKQPSFGKVGGKAELCIAHAKNGMVDVVNKRCGHSGCTKQPSYGKVGGKAKLCAEHASDEMVDVVNKRCSHSGCTKQPSFGTQGSIIREFCAQHATHGMINLNRSRSKGAAESNSNELRRGGLPERGSTTRYESGGRKRKSSRSPSTHRGYSPGIGSRTTKRPLGNVDMPVASASPSAGRGAAAAREGAPRGRVIADEGSSPEPGALEKTEARVRISCKEEPSETQGMWTFVESTSLQFCVPGAVE